MFSARNPFNLRTQWRSHWMGRASIAAELIRRHVPLGSEIADLGCGDQKLRKALNKYPCKYRGYDLIPQSDNVVRLDLTTEPFPEADVTVLLGVLEYIPVLSALRKVRSPILVVSHLYPDEGAFPLAVIREKGWSNVLPKAKFEALLDEAHFRVLECAKADRQHVWIAAKEAVPINATPEPAEAEFALS